MSDKKEIEVKAEQFYREKDRRFTRFVLVADVNRASRKARCVPCDESGMPLRRGLGRATQIKLSNLQTRFELIELDRTEEIDP